MFTFIFNHSGAMHPKAAEFDGKTQNMGHFAVQGHSRSPIMVQIKSPYGLCDFQLVINTPYLAPFRSYSIPNVKNHYFATPLFA